MAGPTGMVLVCHRRTKERHHPVSRELVDGTFKLVDFIHENFEATVHDRVDFFGVELLRKRGEIGHIGK